MRPRYPDFFVVGAARSGTTSLCRYLGSHPAIYLSRNKEPNYFCFEGMDVRKMLGPALGEVLFSRLYGGCTTTERDYLALFSDAPPGTLRGEGSVRYLYYKETAEKIALKSPAAKIIITLRNPVDRLWSHYVMMRCKYHLEPETFENALAREAERISLGWDYDWHYAAVSRYTEQVVRYINHFGRTRVKVVLYDDLSRRPKDVMRDIFSFLGISTEASWDASGSENRGYWLRSRRLDELLTYPSFISPAIAMLRRTRAGGRLTAAIQRVNRVPIPQIPAKTRKALDSLFAEDNKRLGTLLDRHLPW